MISIKNNQLNSVFERIVKDKNGILVRVRFTIVEINGVFQPQIISVIPLNLNKQEETLFIACTDKEQIIFEKRVKHFQKITSPYFSLDFFMSQPTRAPSNR